MPLAAMLIPRLFHDTSSSGPTTLNLTKSAYDAFPVTLHYIYALGDGKLAANTQNAAALLCARARGGGPLSRRVR